MHRSANNIKNSKMYHSISSLVVGVGATLLCLILFSIIMTKVDTPDGVTSVMSSIALCVGSYFSGFIISKKRRKNGLLTGILCGIVIFCLTFIISILFIKTALSMGVFSKLIMILICSSIGGVVGVNAKVKRY